jgi:glycosyltransferase involved in cell wall biosynthesis
MSVNVLHVAQPRDGGVAGYVLAACLDQLARGWDVAVACPDDGRLAADLARAGVPRLSWPAQRSPGPGSARETLRLRALIAARRPRVVHLHAAKAGLAGRLVAGRRIPVMFQPHGWSWLAVDGAMLSATLAWERVAARRTALFVCVGDAEADQGRRQGVRGRYAVIRNGVDLYRFRPAGDGGRAAARAGLGVPADAPLAVCVGRVTRQKGQDVLLAAWPRIRSRCPDARLALVGDGDLLATLRATVRTMPAAGVRWVGAVDDVRGWLAAADVVVLPSRWEGLSLAVLEAFATGRSVVASDVPGLADVVARDVGALVAPDDPAALADAVARRLGCDRLARDEGAAAARHAVRFDLRITYDRLAAATLDLVDRQSADRESADARLADARLADAQAADRRGAGTLGPATHRLPRQRQPTERQPAERQPAERQPDERQPVRRRSGPYRPSGTGPTTDRIVDQV